ncbi:hypothetical protein Q9966_014741 [Columba livia]|nr:hypothetical protein Q9966_014741 [Columba livia]KAK2517769.1 hypothetical protein Q9233_012928 [Columba guinea]
MVVQTAGTPGRTRRLLFKIPYGSLRRRSVERFRIEITARVNQIVPNSKVSATRSFHPASSQQMSDGMTCLLEKLI